MAAGGGSPTDPASFVHALIAMDPARLRQMLAKHERSHRVMPVVRPAVYAWVWRQTAEVLLP